MPMPALSPTMETGTIAEWVIPEGAAFVAGDPLCRIDTDKATIDFEAQDDGILAKILRQGTEARDIAVGTPVCVIVDDESDVLAFRDFSIDSAKTGLAVARTGTTTTTPVAVEADVTLLLPSARHLVQSKGVDASTVRGTGKGGRITKGDVLKVLESLPPLATPHSITSVTALSVATPLPSVVSSPPSLNTTTTPSTSTPSVLVPVPSNSSTSYTDVPNNNMRKIIAKRLTESKRDVPHFYTSVEIELDSVLALRKQLASQHDVKVSVNDFVLKACAMALRDVPEVNAYYHIPSKEVRQNSTIDVSVAVATPTGLITPIVPNVDKIGLVDITDKMKDLATRARMGKLVPEEYQGGTFTVSNMGMFGIDEFSAVINPPQAAILAVGGGSPRFVPTEYVDSLPLEEQPKPSIRTVMTAKLSADRRVVDETTAAMFLQALRLYLNQPIMLML